MTNRERVEDIFRAFATEPSEIAFDRLLAACAVDVTVHEPASGPFGGTYEGREAFRALTKRIDQLIDMQRVRLEHVIAEGEDVIAIVRVTDAVRGVGSMPEALACEWYRFQNGEIVELRPFTWIAPK